MGPAHKLKGEYSKKGFEPAVNKVTFWSECAQGEKALTHSSMELLEKCGVKDLAPTIRSSAVSTAQQCKRKYLYRYRLGLKPKGYTPSLSLGKAYHEIMDRLYQGHTMQRALEAVASYVAEVEEEMLTLVNAAGLLPNGQPLSKVVDQARMDVQKAKVMATWAWAHHPVDFDKWEVLATERLIDIRYMTLTSHIRVRVDSVLRRKGTPHLYIIDHKTSSWSPKQRAATVPYEIQPKLYRLAVEGIKKELEAEAGEPLEVRGFHHYIIQKPTIRWKRNQEWEDYLREIEDWYQRKMEEHPEDPPWYESKLSFTGPAMSEELLMILREADKMTRSRIDGSRFYRDPSGSACFAYNSPCPYLRLCQAPVLDWSDLIPLYYDIKSRDEEDNEESFT